jgi:hypothetical protein
MKYRAATVHVLFWFLSAHLSVSFRESDIVRRLPRWSSKLSNFSEKGTQRRDSRATIDTCCGLVNVYQTHHQPSVTSGETCQNIEGSVKPISRTRCMKSGFNGGVRSVSSLIEKQIYQVDDMFGG